MKSRQQHYLAFFFVAALVLLGLVCLHTVPVSAGEDRGPNLMEAYPDLTAVYVLPIEGAIEPGLAEFVKRVLRQAEQERAAVLLEINTFGGRVDAATEIRDLIFALDVPIISLVTRRAWSAGALITMAAPYAAMAPGASMGAAEPEPRDEKTVSAMRGEFEATAERHNRDPEVAAAMVDLDVGIEDLVPRGRILTLSANKALELGFADLVEDSRDEVLAFFGLDGLVVEVMELNWAERLARVITEPTVSSLLLTIGFLGLIYEITSFGWGVPGTAGILALLLFFGGRYVVGLAGLELILLFAAGMGMIMVEIFVIPGFGFAGTLGILSVLASIFLSYGDLRVALLSVTSALGLSIVFTALFWNKITKSQVWTKLVLGYSEEKDLGYKGPTTHSDLVGKEGMTLTPLRPSGTAEIAGRRYDVVSEGGFLSASVPIKVVRIEGMRVVVQELKDAE